MAIIEGGTEAGRPAVTFHASLPDGSVAMLSLTDCMFDTIAAALRGASERWGVPKKI